MKVKLSGVFWYLILYPITGIMRGKVKIQELIDELTKIRDVDPEKEVVIEVFDTKNMRITRGWMFELSIEDSEDHVMLRQKKLKGWNVYEGVTKEIEEIEESLFPNK